MYVQTSISHKWHLDSGKIAGLESRWDPLTAGQGQERKGGQGDKITACNKQS